MHERAHKLIRGLYTETIISKTWGKVGLWSEISPKLLFLAKISFFYVIYQSNSDKKINHYKNFKIPWFSHQNPQKIPHFDDLEFEIQKDLEKISSFFDFDKILIYYLYLKIF